MTDPDLLLNKDEREVVRREFMARFNDAPSVMEGFHVKRWATGANKGKPKLTAAVQGLLERGLIVLNDEGHWPRARFTDKGTPKPSALCTVVIDQSVMNIFPAIRRSREVIEAASSVAEILRRAALKALRGGVMTRLSQK